MTFAERLYPTRGLKPGEMQILASNLFPSVIQESPFKLWNRDYPIEAEGLSILLGVATFSPQDLKLLDDLEYGLKTGIYNKLAKIRVYDNADDPITKSFGGYFPKSLESICCTPTFAVWQHGRLIDFGGGIGIRDRIFDVLKNDVGAA